MTTATLAAPANGAGAMVSPANQQKRAGLWADLDIPIIVGTGEYSSGKTIFGLMICPGPETLVYDNEGSSLIYRNSLDFDHVDMSMKLMEKFPGGFTPEQRFLWWKEDAIARGKSKKFRVLVVDPVSELEDGLADHIKKNVSKFDLTLDQMKKAPGLFWGAMKREWKIVLDTLRAYYETIYLTVHLRDEFVDNRPSGKREPKGKETLKELASLFLWFEREKDQKIPAAEVQKTRLSKFVAIDGELTPINILPPRLPQATPKRIREYIMNPPDYARLKKDEKPQERTMSDEDKLLIQAKIAESQRITSESELTRLQLMQKNAADQAAALEAAAAKRTYAPDRSAELAQAQAEKTAARARPPISQSQIAQIVTLLTDLFGSAGSPEANEFLAPRIAAFGVNKPTEMTDAQGEGLMSDLLKLRAERQQAKLVARGAELRVDCPMGQSGAVTSPEPPFTPDPEPVQQQQQPPIPQAVTAEQRAEANRLIPLAFPDEATRGAKLPGFVLKHGAPRPDLLTFDQFNSLLAEMRAMAAANTTPAPVSQPVPQAPAEPKASQEQLDRLKDYATRTGWSHDKQAEWLTARNCRNFRDCTAEQVNDKIEELMQVELGFRKGGPPGN